MGYIAMRDRRSWEPGKTFGFYFKCDIPWKILSMTVAFSDLCSYRSLRVTMGNLPHRARIEAGISVRKLWLLSRQ